MNIDEEMNDANVMYVLQLVICTYFWQFLKTQIILWQWLYT